MLEKIPEQKTGGNTIIYSPVIKQKKSGAFVDALLTVLLIVIVFALEASYFVVFNPDMQINAKSLTLNTLWFAIGTIAVGGLTKKIAKDKGRETKEYEEAEKAAAKAKNWALASLISAVILVALYIFIYFFRKSRIYSLNIWIPTF